MHREKFLQQSFAMATHCKCTQSPPVNQAYYLYVLYDLIEWTTLTTKAISTGEFLSMKLY